MSRPPLPRVVLSRLWLAKILLWFSLALGLGISLSWLSSSAESSSLLLDSAEPQDSLVALFRLRTGRESFLALQLC